MTLGRKDFSVTRTDGGAHVFRLAGFLGDDDLIGHDGLGWKNRFDRTMRTYSEQSRLSSLPAWLRRRRTSVAEPVCFGLSGARMALQIHSNPEAIWEISELKNTSVTYHRPG